MAPLLFIFTLKEEYYHLLWKLVRLWSKLLIYGMGFRLNIQLDQVIEPGKSYMFCPNHGSLMDPFVLIVLSKNPIVFVGKQELVKIPIFGFFYKRAVIMVDRSSPESRKRVYERAKKRLQNGVSMAIFPEGLVPTEDVILAPFKKGAFHLAMEAGVPIIPIVIKNAYMAMPKGTSMFKPTHIEVVVLDPVDTSPWKVKNINKHIEDVRELYLNELEN